jgi:hypothetical protein
MESYLTFLLYLLPEYTTDTDMSYKSYQTTAKPPASLRPVFRKLTQDPYASYDNLAVRI